MGDMNWRKMLIPAIALCVVLPVPPVQAAPSIRHYDLRLLLQPEKSALEGTATLTLDPDGASELLLQIAP